VANIRQKLLFLAVRQICNAPVGNVINASGRGIPGQLADFFGISPKTNAILRTRSIT